MEAYIDLCVAGKAEPEHWEKYIESNINSNIAPHEILGISEEDFAKLHTKQHTFEFYVLRKKICCKIKCVWPGMYVSFLVENDNKPHIEFGWVDVIDVDGKLCKIQCDDAFCGMRAYVVSINDIKDILPIKERPLVYYKTVLCQKCNKCDRSANSEVSPQCPHKAFFDAILDKQVSDAQYLLLYAQNNDLMEKYSNAKQS